MDVYEPRPVLKDASIAGLQAGVIGLGISTLQNALGHHSYGAAGVLTRTGGTIGFLAAMGATFSLTKSVAANQRHTDDHINGAIGGCAAGFLAGVRAHSIPVAIGGCAFLGAVAGSYQYIGPLGGVGKPNGEKRSGFFNHPNTQ